MPTSVMEAVNSEIGPYEKIVKRQSPINHESTKIKILDYLTIFKVLKQAKGSNWNPRWGNIPFLLPVLGYINDPDGIFEELC